MCQTFCLIVEGRSSIVTAVFSYFSRLFVHGHSYLKVLYSKCRNAGGASGAAPRAAGPKGGKMNI